MKLKSSVETTGCFIIKNSSVASSSQNLTEVLSQMDTFFKSKNKAEMPNVFGKGATRGFFPTGAETGNKAIFENKESFSFGDDTIPQSFIDQSNLVAKNIYHEDFKPEPF